LTPDRDWVQWKTSFLSASIWFCSQSGATGGIGEPDGTAAAANRGGISPVDHAAAVWRALWRFGADIATISAWLESRGMHVRV